MKNKILSASYTGTPEKWVDFIMGWQAAMGVELACDKSLLNKTPRKWPVLELPKSCSDFYMAMQALGWPDILKVFETRHEDEAATRLKIIRPDRVDLLFYYEPSLRKVAIDDAGEKVPQFVAKEEGRHYTRAQYHEFYSRAFVATYPIASRSDSVYENWLTINPLVRFQDGEWEALYVDMRAHVFLKFRSFADAICWFYLTDIGLYPDQDEFPWLDHSFDTTGLSKLLFAE